jgi:ferric-dicitrate binding protein FerR (iron transport regulator)
MNYRGGSHFLSQYESTRHLIIQIGVQIGRLTRPVITNNVFLSGSSESGHDGKRGGRPRTPLWRYISLLGGIAIWMIRAFLPGGSASTQYFAAEVDQPRHVILDDGSLLDLRADSVVALETVGTGRRIVLIRGEVLLNVVHNVSRHVDVFAGSALAQVLGTQFDVSLRSGATKVTVIEGALNVSRLERGELTIDAKTPSVRVVSRECIEINPNRTYPDIVQTVSLSEIESALSWNVRVFSAAPVGEIIEELNRYNAQRKIIVHDSSILATRVGVTVEMGNPQAFADWLQTLAPDILATAGPGDDIYVTRRSAEAH